MLIPPHSLPRAPQRFRCRRHRAAAAHHAPSRSCVHWWSLMRTSEAIPLSVHLTSSCVYVSFATVQGNTVLVFNPPLKLGEDYTVSSVAPEKVSLQLKPGKKWRATGGPLTLLSIGVGDGPVPLGGGAGIKV